jgi:CRISPR-associated protein Cmr6
MSKNKDANQPAKSPKNDRQKVPASDLQRQRTKPSASSQSDPMLSLPRLDYSDPGKSFDRMTGLEEVPMEYRAQILGRCQRQFVRDDTKGSETKTIDVVKWAHEWSMASSDHPPAGRLKPETGIEAQSLRIDIQQRLVSNSGLDADLIRPVIGGNGWPVIPGSSLKGLFRRQCRILNEPRLARWCGNECGAEPSQQGKLRFHGAYPADNSWKDKNGVFLVDITHPQQNWQIGFKDKKHSAYAIISLHKPRLIVTVSSSDSSIGKDEWQDINTILSLALARQGLGGRTCAGYGISAPLEPNDVLFECAISGRGSAPMLLGRQAEFRTTMFRAAIRDMALRIFAGLTREDQALKEVETLFGGIDGGSPTRSILSFRYIDIFEPTISRSSTQYVFDVFTASGKLQWSLNLLRRSLPLSEIEDLRTFLAALHGLVLVLGGFGKGWRRIDHEFFGASMRAGRYDKAPIGCHWQWSQPSQMPDLLRVDGPERVARLLHTARHIAKRRLGVDSGELHISDWQEVIDPKRMLIWTRTADDVQSSLAINWFHAKSQNSDLPGSLCLNRSVLGGRLQNKKMNDGPTCVSRIWHRMFPLQSCPETPGRAASGVKPASNPAAIQRAPRGASMRQASSQGNVKFWNGPFMESIVLFPFDQFRGSSVYVPGAQALLEELERLEQEGHFQRLHW